MLTCTFGEILLAPISDINSLRMPLAEKVYYEWHHLYAYQNTQTSEMLYVGRSYLPLQRLREHMSQNRSAIELYMNQNRPACYEWMMFLFTAEECGQLVRDYLPRKYESYQGCYTWALEVAEQALIAHYWPKFNVSYRYHTRSHRYFTRPLARRDNL